MMISFVTEIAVQDQQYVTDSGTFVRLSGFVLRDASSKDFARSTDTIYS